MKLYCFPKKQDLYLIYSSFSAFHSELFRNLYIQASSKNSIFFRFLKTKIGLQITKLFASDFEVPKLNSDFVGIVKKGRVILFELENNEPVKVWKQDNDSSWNSYDFIGYQLISEYTLHEFDIKYDLIYKALKTHWNLVLENSCNIHGDLTHFNILVDIHNKIHFIDRKSNNHSKLFDFFYFYSYLKQCVSRTVTLSKKEQNQINDKLRNILKEVCHFNSQDEFDQDFQQLNIPRINGLINANNSKKNFLSIFNSL